MGEFLLVNCMFGAGFLKEEGCGDFLGLAGNSSYLNVLRLISYLPREEIGFNNF